MTNEFQSVINLLILDLLRPGSKNDLLVCWSVIETRERYINLITNKPLPIPICYQKGIQLHLSLLRLLLNHTFLKNCKQGQVCSGQNIAYPDLIYLPRYTKRCYVKCHSTKWGLSVR